MNNLLTPLAIVIGAALIAGAIVISGGVYEYEAPYRPTVYRYNKFTGSIYRCNFGKPCEPFKPAQEASVKTASDPKAEMQEGRDVLDRFKVVVPVPNESQ